MDIIPSRKKRTIYLLYNAHPVSVVKPSIKVNFNDRINNSFTEYSDVPIATLNPRNDI